MPPQTPTKLTKTATAAAKTTVTAEPLAAAPPHAHLATEPLPLPKMSPLGRVIIVLAILLVLLGIAAAITAVILYKPPVDPLVTSQTAVEEAMQKLRSSNWLNLEGVSREELDRRIRLLDEAINASDSFNDTVSKLDRASPENTRVHERCDAFNARAKVLRMGRLRTVFLRDRFGHWLFLKEQVRWDNEAMMVEYAPIEELLGEGMAQLKSATQPGPPVRHDLIDTATEPQPQPPPAPPRQ